MRGRALASLSRFAVKSFASPLSVLPLLRLRQIPLAVLVPGEGVPEGARLGLAGKHQRVNAALAVALSAEWAQRTGRHKEAEAVREVRSPGLSICFARREHGTVYYTGHHCSAQGAGATFSSRSWCHTQAFER